VISEFFNAILWAALPVGFCSYGLAWWAIKKGYVDPVSSVKSLEKAVKKRNKDKELKKEGDAVHRKWLAFGGGYYGVVALLTYAVVELGEIRDFITQFGGIADLFRNLSFDLLIDLVINSFMNFVVAISWPAYWLAEFDRGDIWIWFIVSYAGYWVGGHLAVRKSGQQNGTDI
jgi:hypothetical protein